MKLIEAIKAEGRSITSVAREWGVEPSSLTRAINGQNWPSTRILVRAHEFSGGKVGVADWIEACRDRLERDGILTPTEGAIDGRGKTSRDETAEGSQGAEAAAG